ncbi:MAG: hypothetical protein AMXMBFR66_32480 [Pseudomonadota bacterium]|nr:hypothetical protein [Rubrivivax sp.]NLZ40974.1 hypothetical protein [Comamonadaceae bacterium]
MSDKRRVLLLEDGGAPALPTALEDALRAHGAEILRMRLDAPCDALLDALAEGWLPVLVGPAGPAADH